MNDDYADNYDIEVLSAAYDCTYCFYVWNWSDGTYATFYEPNPEEIVYETEN